MRCPVCCAAKTCAAFKAGTAPAKSLIASLRFMDIGTTLLHHCWMSDLPFQLAHNRKIMKRETAWVRTQLECDEISARRCEKSRSGSVVGAENTQLDIVPIHLRRTLGHLDMRYHRMILNQQHNRNLAGHDLLPLRALIYLASLIIDPRARRQIDLTTRRLVKHRSHQQARAEHVLVINGP